LRGIYHATGQRSKSAYQIQIKPFNQSLVRCSEFIIWRHLQAGIGTQTWSCDPSNPSRKIVLQSPAKQRVAERRSKIPINLRNAGCPEKVMPSQ
jgi:hypothetical protein